MHIRQELIDLNGDFGSKFISKNKDESKKDKMETPGVIKTKQDGIARWESGGRIIKTDGNLGICGLIHDTNNLGTNL